MYSMTLPVMNWKIFARKSTWADYRQYPDFLPGRAEEAHEKPQFVQAGFWKISAPRTTLM
jgi:hypothetical protein